MLENLETPDVYQDYVHVDFRFLGLEMLLCPFPLNNSGPRSDMFAKQLTQIQMLAGAEMPKIFTGYEHIIGQYEFDTTERDQDAEILAVIPKYKSVSGMHQINENPSTTIVYLGLKDRQIHYCDLHKFTKATDGYGYRNIMRNTHRLLTPGTFLPKEEKLCTSPIHNGEQYNLGVEVNVAYMTLPETIEDALVISKSLAKRMQSRAIKTVSIRVSPNQHPLNLYGDNDEFRFIPDIGQVVNDDGILCGFRTPTDSTFISDTLDTELYTPHPMHDRLYRAPAGSVILDVEFFVNKNKVPKHLYVQMEKYVDAMNQYFKEIVETYKKYKGKNDISPEFNSLVSRAIARLSASDIRVKDIPFRGNSKLISKDTVIDFLQIDITYTHPINVTNGFKMTGRDGNKGVVCAIWDDEDMPVDDYGIRADMCIDPVAGFNRMNGGQWYEQYINRVSWFVQQELKQNKNFDYLMEYVGTINPVYEATLRKMYTTKDAKEKFVEENCANGIFLHIPPGLKTIDENLPILLEQKYNAEITPVTYNLELKDGSKKRIRTHNPVCIGSKYIYLLYKMPAAAAAGSSYVNQFKTPIRPNKAAQMLSPISQTPIRFAGEDEVRILNNGADPESVRRLMCLQANSPEGVKRLIHAMLTAPKPSRIDHVDISNEDLVETNTIMGIVHHMFATVGIESRNVKTNPLTKAETAKFFSSIVGD